jgi:hypothetical protein
MEVMGRAEFCSKIYIFEFPYVEFLVFRLPPMWNVGKGLLQGDLKSPNCPSASAEAQGTPYVKNGHTCFVVTINVSLYWVCQNFLHVRDSGRAWSFLPMCVTTVGTFGLALYTLPLRRPRVAPLTCCEILSPISDQRLTCVLVRHRGMIVVGQLLCVCHHLGGWTFFWGFQLWHVPISIMRCSRVRSLSLVNECCGIASSC